MTSNREIKRIQNLPRISYPEELPILSRRLDIVNAIRENQVVIISGETGSGKSTQIPKMCLEAGRGIRGRIGCTQPRRIAASTISRRIAEELGEEPGRSIGYKIRFQDRTPENAYIKVMTDGILLAETRGDPLLREYDTLIIDEAHERSLNIDFILGIVRNLLTVRPELKVIVTSATMDTEKFSGAFNNAPVIKVSGRLFPVDVEYMPLDPVLEDEGEITYVDQAVDAADRLRKRGASGDMLIFMPTEQDILETCERLEGRGYPGVSVLPLFARLPASRQGLIYSVKGTKIVVATNVAETSLTIPGIKYVIDTGLARLSHYIPRTRTNTLPVTPISKSSADQRKGRCGRVRNGVCIRLYSEDDYMARPEFTDPEILRSSLAEVILRMLDLNMGDPLSFPFIDQPSPRSVKDGYDLLRELGAVVGQGSEIKLTEKGRLMAAMPLDPRISRMMIEASKEGCVKETAVIAAALSIQDPMERPMDKAVQADQAHLPFRDQTSDFLTLLNTWNKYHREWEGIKGQSSMRKFCKAHFLSFVRMREWIYTHAQIMEIMKDLEMPVAKPIKEKDNEGAYARIHRSVLSGFLSNIAVRKEKGIYQATRGKEVMIFPGSTLFKKNPDWIVASEMVRTSRLYARNAARIDPAWLESLGGDLCKSSYDEPHWEKNRGEVVALEKVTIFGLPIVTARPVSYTRINPDEAHEIFIRSGLMQGDIKPAFPFLKHNMALIKTMENMEHKLRRRDILAGEDTLAAFYSKRLEGISDVRTLSRLIREKGSDEFLRIKEEDLLRTAPDESDLSMFPDEFSVGGARFKASYRFSPGKEDDGVTIGIPASLASGLPTAPFEWGIKGLMKEKVTELIKGLPKKYRRQLVPVSNTVDIILNEMEPGDCPFLSTLSRFVYERFHVDIPAEAWSRVEIPDHLMTRVAILDNNGKEIRTGRDITLMLQSGKETAAMPGAPEFQDIRHKWERSGIREWNFEDLPDGIQVRPGILVYPGLEPGEDSVGIRLFLSQDEASAKNRRGVQMLLNIRLDRDIKLLKRNWPLPEEAGRIAVYFGGRQGLEKVMLRGVLEGIFPADIRSRDAFEAHAALVSKEMFDRFREVREHVINILNAYERTRSFIMNMENAKRSGQSVRLLCALIRKEMDSLVPRDFPERYTAKRLMQIPRYLRAMEIRVERGSHNPEKDRLKEEQAEAYLNSLKKMTDGLSPHASMEKRDMIDEFRWMIEEFKVSLFAPEVGTAFPVSKKRLDKYKQDIERIV
ncbi:MAG: ATP-dependent RNA helicase HrpA [Deltaproteobacteria bacterium]|nr:ATP-dependent RNA helicase HrpA [Deltaproteobacteria bacterium]